MEHRQFGKSGLSVSSLSLGAMTFGEARGFMKGVSADDAEARRIFEAALEAGCTPTNPVSRARASSGTARSR